MPTITHSHATGTLIEDTTRGDGTAAILKTHRWRWSRNLSAWYVPRSRDHDADIHLIHATADALTAAGHLVTVTIDNHTRPTADVEADRTARQIERTTALQAKAARAHTRALAADERDAASTRALPPLGEPIKVGHHSEAGHRKAVEKAIEAGIAAAHAHDAAREADQRAATAAATTGARYAPETVARRIQRLTADLGRLQRQLSGYTERTSGIVVAPLTGDRREHAITKVGQITDQIDYWTTVRAAQLDQGVATDYGPHNVHAGDQIRLPYGWVTVTRANPKTATVTTGLGTHRVPWHSVREHQPRTT